MRKVIFLLITILCLPSTLWAADPRVGTWKLNVEKSTFGRPPLKRDIVKFEELESGIKMIGDYITDDGEAHHVEGTSEYGKDYPCGEGTCLTIKIDAYTFDTVIKEDGKVLATAREVFSKDGKTLTRTYTVKDEKGQILSIDICIYERQ